MKRGSKGHGKKVGQKTDTATKLIGEPWMDGGSVYIKWFNGAVIDLSSADLPSLLRHEAHADYFQRVSEKCRSAVGKMIESRRAVIEVQTSLIKKEPDLTPDHKVPEKEPAPAEPEEKPKAPRKRAAKAKAVSEGSE